MPERNDGDIIDSMPQLIVRKIEAKLVRELKERAGRHGISMEEEHRRILRSALSDPPRRSFKEFMASLPEGLPDELFARDQSREREVEL